MKSHRTVRGACRVFAFLLFLSCSLYAPAEGMPVRPLGRTGHDMTIFSLGGQAVIERRGQDEKADEIINRALDLGVNYIDTAPAYGGGISETYIGRVMEDRRDEVFLATKSHDYSYSGTIRLVEESLRRLRTGRLDLYQHHNVGSLSQLERITSEDGALKAFLELKEKGTVRFIGITSHSPKVLLEALELDVYDCMLITLNPSGANMRDRDLLDEFFRKAEEKGVGVVAMKLFSRGALIGGRASAEELFRYALSHPVSGAVIGISEPWQLDDNVKSARNFKEMTPEEKRKIERVFR